MATQTPTENTSAAQVVRATTVATTVALSAIIVAAGCDGKSSMTSPKVVASAGIVDPAICDSFISSALAAQYFPGLPRATKSTKITPDVVDCDIRFGETRVQIQCGAKVNDAAAIGLARQQYASLGTPVASLGQLAYSFGPENIQFWDDDGTCSVRIDAALLKVDLIAVARAIAAELGPQAVTK